MQPSTLSSVYLGSLDGYSVAVFKYQKGQDSTKEKDGFHPIALSNTNPGPSSLAGNCMQVPRERTYLHAHLPRR